MSADEASGIFGLGLTTFPITQRSLDRPKATQEASSETEHFNLYRDRHRPSKERLGVASTACLGVDRRLRTGLATVEAASITNRFHMQRGDGCKLI